MDKYMDIDQKMIDYIFSHTSELHPVQKKIIKFNEKLGYIKKLQISVLQANFIEFLIKFKKFKSCLEIGTFTGYSALSIALSLPKNGKLYCIDKNEEKLNIAKKFFKQARVNKKIFTDISNAKESLLKLKKNAIFNFTLFIFVKYCCVSRYTRWTPYSCCYTKSPNRRHTHISRSLMSNLR